MPTLKPATAQDSDARRRGLLLAFIEKVFEQLKKGAKFEDLAKANSSDGSKDQGGDLGPSFGTHFFHIIHHFPFLFRLYANPPWA